MQLEEPVNIDWAEGDCVHIPFRLYTDPEIYARELQQLFYSNHWCYVGLDAEVPNPGEFKRTAIGEREVILTRDRHRAIHVVENRCAPRRPILPAALRKHEELGLPIPSVQLRS